jgi:hypothetical protein
MTTFIYARTTLVVVDMALGEKLFEDIGNLTKLDIKSVHPVEGVKMEVSFTSEIKGLGKFPSGKNIGSGIVTQYPHGVIDGNYQGMETTTTEGDQYIWWAHEKSKVIEGGMFKGIIIITGYANSQKLSWMNNLIAVIDMQTDLTNRRFEGTGYEWH